PVERVDVPPNAFQLRAVVRLDRSIAILLQLAHLRLDRRLVDAGDIVVLVRLDPECLRERRQQVLLVHLRVALHRVVVLDGLGDVAEFLDRLFLEVVKRIGRHGRTSFSSAYLKTLFGILTCTPTLGLSTSCVTATLPAMLTT